MKKWMVVVVLVIMFALLAVSAAPVLAGGGQVQGEKGQGQTEEHGCTEQPCFDENADQPKIGK
jgi:hypothetical protein